MDPFFGFHIEKGIARNVNIENGPPNGARFLDPKTGSAFWWNCEGFCCSVFAPDTCLVCSNLKFFAGLHFWYGSWFVAWLFINHAPTYATVGRRFTYQALRVVLEPISRNRQQHCFKILWSFNFCPSGAVHRWSMVATLGVRRMASPELVIQSPQIRFHFRLYFSKKDQIARRREWFSGVSSRAFLWFVSGPSESPDPCSQCCVGMQTLEFSQKLVLQFQHWLQG